MNPERAPRAGLPLLLTAAAVMCVLLPFTTQMPHVWRLAFCAPTAGWSAMLLNAPWFPTEEGYLIAQPALAVHVTRACSGAQFFCLLCALMAAVGMTVSPARSGSGIASRWRLPRLRVGAVAACLPAAYVLTILANTARVTLGWWAGIWTRYTLGVAFQPAVHLAVGLCVFTAFLTAGYAATVWMTERCLAVSRRPGPVACS